MKTDIFLTYLRQRRNYSELTVKSYESDLLQFESFLTKDDNDKSVLEDDGLITVNSVRSWIMTLSEQGISARSINRKLSSLRAYFRWVEINNAEFKNPMLKIVSPKMSKRRLSAITNDDMQMLLEQRPSEEDFDAFRNYVIVELLYATGIRQAELLGIKQTDISFTDRQLKIFGKGNKERIIPIGQKLMDDIIKYIDLKQRYSIKQTALMVTKEGKVLTKEQLYRIVHKLLENVNISEKSPHTFRHTCATHLVEEGADIMNVKNLLGHSSLKATEIYTHTTIEQLKKEYKRTFEQNFN